MTIATTVVDDVIAHANQCRPRECCGLLLGNADHVSVSVRARNTADDFNRFVIDPRDHIDARRAARAQGLDVIGFYHSHPHSTAVPSATDLAEATYPQCVHLIVGLVGGMPEIRMFRYADGLATELALTGSGNP